MVSVAVRVLLILLFMGCVAQAQTCTGQFPPNTVCGNLGVTPALPGPVTFPGITTLNVATFTGATLDVQLSNCIAALPSTGGVCDARSVPSGGTINAMQITKSGVNILGPCGSFTVNGRIIVGSNSTQMSAFRWIGCGGGFYNVGTIFNWAGNSTDPMFTQITTFGSVLSDFSIQAPPGFPLAEGIRQENGPAGTSSGNIYERLYIFATVAGPAPALNYGIRWCNDLSTVNGLCDMGGDGNNDLSYVANVIVQNYNVCAFSIEGIQSKMHVFQNSTFQGGGIVPIVTITGSPGNALVDLTAHGLSNGQAVSFVAASGTLPTGINDHNSTDTMYYVINATTNSFNIATTPGGSPVTISSPGTGAIRMTAITSQSGVCTDVRGGSFRWYGGAGGNNLIADFNLGSPDDAIYISGINIESSSRLLNLPSATAGVAWDITISGGRWSADRLHVDGNFVIYNLRGPLNINGLAVQGGLNSPVVLMNPNGSPILGNMVGNSIQSSSAGAGYIPFVCVNTSIPPSTCFNTIGNFSVDFAQNNYVIPPSSVVAPILVSKLPICNSTFSLGATYLVSDQATTAAWHGAVTGGGAATQWVVCGAGNAYYQQ
jgi:hypothetical protein